MSDAWWTPATVQDFATAARVASTTASIAIAAISLFSKLPGTVNASIFSKVGTEGAFGMGRTLGFTVGMLSGAAIDNQIDYYTGLETTCLTRSSCATS